MRIALFMVCLALTSTAAEAQIRLNGKSMGENRLSESAAPVAVTDDGAVAMRDHYCRQLVRHQPAADVAYKPASDPNVIPADISPSLDIDTTGITIPLNIPISRYLKDPSKYNVPMSDETQVAVGLLSLDGQGNLLLNGQPVNMSPEDAAVLCGGR
jgi:hypothetical protein